MLQFLHISSHKIVKHYRQDETERQTSMASQNSLKPFTTQTSNTYDIGFINILQS